MRAKTKPQKKLRASFVAEPFSLNNTAWFYVERDHLTVVHEVHDSLGYYKTETLKIAYGKLLRALERGGIVKPKRKKK